MSAGNEVERVYEFIKVRKKDHLTVVKINRPEVMNCLHIPANKELDEAFNEFSEDPDAWVAIITGAGDKAFSAGFDIKAHPDHGSGAHRESLNSLKGGFGGISQRFDCFKPVIAAVNGLAYGGGFEIALACDIVIAASHATFALAEVRVGKIAGAGGVHRLARQLPYHAAMGYILTGRPMTAEAARQFGFVNDVVPAGDLMAAAENWAADVIACAPLAVRAAKEAVNQGFAFSLAEAFGKPYPGVLTMYESEDYVEGPRAFAEKRKPKWKGR